MTDLEQAIADMVRKALEELMAPDRLYSAEELAERYHRPLATIQAWIRAGLFGETVNTSARNHLVTEEGIRRYEEDHLGPAYDPDPPAAKRRSRKRPPAAPGRI